MRRLFLIGALSLLAATSTTTAQPAYTGPWDPAAEAAAERAVARMGANRSLNLRVTIRAIKGLETSVR
jgi:hypothetical protein